MKKVFLLGMTLLLLISTFRVLNGREYISLDVIVYTFSEYEFSFEKTHKHIYKVKNEFEEAKNFWDNINNPEEEEETTQVLSPPNGLLGFLSPTELVPLTSTLKKIVRNIGEYVVGIWNYIKCFFLCIGVVITLVIDLVVNLYNLFNLAMNLLGFNVPTID